jgi:RecA/RadA recombinase
MKKHKHKMSAGETVEYIKKALGYATLAKPPEYWLDTGWEYLNKVLGSPKLGLAYGKLYTIAGAPSSGKSAIAAWLEGLAQKDGADVAWVDGENSFDAKHFKRHGLDVGHRIRNKDGKVVGYTNVALFRPEYGMFEHKKKSKLDLEDVEAAEQLFERVETWMKLRRKLNPHGKLVVTVDSTTAFCPEEEMAAAFNQNMRTRMSPAVFLNTLTKRWVNLALHTNAMVFLIAQLRDNPNPYGQPKRITGGNGILYYPSCIVWMNRVKGGEIKKNKDQVGTQGEIKNTKNKVGAGSEERKRCGYKCYFYKNAWKFMDSKKLKKEE